MTVMVAIIAGLLAVNAFSTAKVGRELKNIRTEIEKFELPEIDLGGIFGNGNENGNRNPYNYGDDFFSQFFGGEDDYDNYWYYGDDYYGNSYDDQNDNSNENQNKPDQKDEQNRDGFRLDDIYDFFSGLFSEDSQGA